MTEAEEAFLRASSRGRLATLGDGGEPVAAAVAYQLRPDGVLLLAGARAGAGATWQHVQRDPRASLLVDDGTPGRGVLVIGRGRTTAGAHGQPLVELRPERVQSWGL